MQFKVVFLVVSLATFVAASPASPFTCSTGPVQCCDTLTTASDLAAASALGLVGVVLQDLNVGIGLTCSPITGIGASLTSCNAQAVCCKDNSHGSLVSIGCVPVAL
ncbi:hypothetical protein GYMLUDRAFT_178501 [Collybiopsis luxurians FD-317 M1]|uniref:Hydrophobin n=1 Tax=Collybiopsis luxurians FD-317 M1 TaxID=944289 RepID=A0A0D0ATH2_9AGAR|nr:hypothetical protein GYMLUDRAFT_178501 [Collybiopsis luxurians FD-317 M1]